MIETHCPGSRGDWLALRHHDVTASTVAALLGVHPRLTAYELYAEKAGIVAPDDVGASSAMLRGQLLESVAVEMLRRSHPTWQLTPNAMPGGLYFRDTNLRLGATPDCFAIDQDGRKGVIQVKSVEPSVYRREWLEGDLILPPLWAVAQAMVEAYLTGSQFAALAPLRVGYGIEIDLVDVPLHEGVLDRVKREVLIFWQRVAELRPPPMDYGRDGKLIADMMPRDDGTSISLAHDNEFVDAVIAHQEAKGQIKLAEETVKRAEALIRERMGMAATATTAQHIVTAKTTTRAGHWVRDSVFRSIKVKDLGGSHHA